MRKLAATLTTARGSAMLRTLTVACMEHEDTAVKLRAGFSLPLHDSVRARLLADGIDETTAESAADAIVGGVVYPILSDAQPYSRRRAELHHAAHRRVLEAQKLSDGATAESPASRYIDCVSTALSVRPRRTSSACCRPLRTRNAQRTHQT